MKIIENMLNQWVNIPNNVLEITNQKIIEVDAFEMLNPSTDLIIGHVLTCEKHPNADTLHVTTVDLGDRVEQIVCGAANVAKGQYVIVAQVGTILPGDFKIKSTRIRGIDSNGMICSLNELAIDEKYIPETFKDGIYYFDGPREIGSPALKHLSLDGWVMELGLTPNRADLLSVLGFAYDLASMTGQKVKLKEFKIKEETKKNPIQVEIDTDGCGRYYARYFENVKVKPSPWWLKSALIAQNIKPINNVVDISNYVMLEYGTPLHMFDHKKLGSDHILVRNAKKGEKVVTLDEEKRVLEAHDVVITNGKKIIAIGGVMGLLDSMIDDQTSSVVLEAAYFDPKHIYKTSKRLDLKSDSSYRFERGIDDERVYLGLERATELLVELCDAKVSKGVSKSIRYQVKNPKITVAKDYFNQRLGVNIPEKELISYFEAYNYTYKVLDNTFEMTAPSYRKDILIPADLVEEVARMYGLDKIPMQTIQAPLTGKLTSKQKRLRAIRHQLANLGLTEVITYSLLPTDQVYKYNRIGEAVSILMPLSEDKKTLRQSLVHGLLETIRYNQSRQQESVAVFEIGHCFAKGLEPTHLGIVLSGAWHKNPWKKEKITPDFYLLKGILASVFNPLGIEFTYENTSQIDVYHPYRQANILHNKKVVGHIAELHPNEAKRLDIDKTYCLEMNITALLEETTEVNYQVVSKYPSITRDMAIVVDENIQASELIDMIWQTARKHLVNLDVFDIYQGSNIETGKKSIAFNLVFNDTDKTLGSDEVDQLMKKITNRLAFSYQATIRK
ncbi:phenylalanine--tRNA ligase subunit beta [Peloplasma aerotolerans]|uniref:Phenylalanine--tRNA ligase beta subunit n=1 Tax=Peloplasma aerotolerans TaxID=3044389 RepID=A0AAW6U6H0_9MOLU|nr:phenylalanine--tRNA ligase subunit beta [Mariniplasma sp. M4Ah]MDI6453561.1 phenylalanine--tRNA ligase subunit beta [Mariniplasma sp. M4Ah]